MIKVQTQQVYASDSGISVTFDFSQTVFAYVVGLSNLDYEFSLGAPTNVNQLGFSVSSSSSSSVVTVTPTFSLTDGGNNYIDGTSSATITVLAWVEDSNHSTGPSQCFLPTYSGLYGTQWTTLDYNSSLSCCLPYISGFEFNFNSANPSFNPIACAIQDIQVVTGAQIDVNDSTSVGLMSMAFCDMNGDNTWVPLASGSVSGGTIGLGADAMTWQPVYSTIWTSAGTASTFSIPFETMGIPKGTTLNGAAILLAGFDLHFVNQMNPLLSFQVGISDADIAFSSTDVTFPSNSVFLEGGELSASTGTATYIVLAW